MVNIWYHANGVVSLVCAAFLSWIVLHPHIREGVVVKLGLMIMIISLLATAALTLQESTSWSDYWRAAMWLRIGICIACTGVVVRVVGLPFHRPQRRMTDWLRYHAEDHRHENTHHGRTRGH